MRPDRIKVFVGDARSQPFTVAARTFGRIGAEREIDRMRREEALRSQPEVIARARPFVVRRIIDHRGAHRVELDVSVDGQGIALRVDQAGSEAAFP